MWFSMNGGGRIIIRTNRAIHTKEGSVEIFPISEKTITPRKKNKKSSKDDPSTTIDIVEFVLEHDEDFYIRFEIDRADLQKLLDNFDNLVDPRPW